MSFYCVAFKDYKLLKEEFLTLSDFNTALAGSFSTTFDDVTIPSAIKTSLSTFLTKIGQGIYRFYVRDKIAYLDKDIFIERLVNTIALNMNYYFQLQKLDFMVAQVTDTSKFMLTSSLSSDTNETGSKGNVVVQSSSLTPTGVDATDTGNSMSIELTEDDDETSLETTEDAFVNKYTNYQGKTNGVQRNHVNRNNELSRNGDYIHLADVIERLPKSYFNKLLQDVSEHFIMVY